MKIGEMLMLTVPVQRMLREPEDFEPQGEILVLAADSPTLWKLLPIGLTVKYVGNTGDGSKVFEIVDTREVGGDVGSFSDNYKQMRFMPASFVGKFRKL